MIALIFKNWKLLLDILLVVGGIILFTIFDPFGIFVETQTQKTANMVSGVRSIGQLVTAEYYGEVMSSWKDYQLSEFPEDTITETAKMLYLDLMMTFQDANQKFKNLYPDNVAVIKKNYPPELYSKFIIFLGNQKYNLPLKKIYDEKEKNGFFDGNAEKKILERFYSDIQDQHKSYSKQFKKEPDQFLLAYREYLTSIPDYVYGFNGFFQGLTKIHLQSRPGRKDNIVLIGRGWVKAGFDFGNFDMRNFQYDKENKIVHFFGIYPSILDTDINPWFIPQLKVKGFELVEYSGDVDFEEAKKVKHLCKLKLLEKARQADIISQAMANGEETLQNFFSIVLDEPDIKISFHTLPFDKYWAMVSSDTLIDISEALYIDSLYRIENATQMDTLTNQSASMASYRKQQFGDFIQKLKTLPFINKKYSFNYYSITAAEILKDSWHFSKSDLELLLNVRDTLLTYGQKSKQIGTSVSIQNEDWFDDGKFMHDFNHTLQLLNHETYTYDKHVQIKLADAIFTKNKDTLFYDSIPIVKWDSLNKELPDTIEFTYQALNSKKSELFDDYKYDISAFGLLNDKKIENESELQQELQNIPLSEIKDVNMLRLRKQERDTIGNYILTEYRYKNKLTPVKVFTKSINKLFTKTNN